MSTTVRWPPIGRSAIFGLLGLLGLLGVVLGWQDDLPDLAIFGAVVLVPVALAIAWVHGITVHADRIEEWWGLFVPMVRLRVPRRCAFVRFDDGFTNEQQRTGRVASVSLVTGADVRVLLATADSGTARRLAWATSAAIGRPLHDTSSGRLTVYPPELPPLAHRLDDLPDPGDPPPSILRDGPGWVLPASGFSWARIGWRAPATMGISFLVSFVAGGQYRQMLIAVMALLGFAVVGEVLIELARSRRTTGIEIEEEALTVRVGRRRTRIPWARWMDVAYGTAMVGPEGPGRPVLWIVGQAEAAALGEGLDDAELAWLELTLKRELIARSRRISAR